MKRHLVARNDQAAATMVAGLEAAGIPVLLLKGPATRELLGQPDRDSADIDILVPAAARRRAGSVLRQDGYRRSRGIHSENWTHPTQAAVDLHRTLPRVGVGPRAVWRILSGGHRVIDVAGRQVPVLSTPAGLVHLAIHATQDSGTRPKADLRAALEKYDSASWHDAAIVAHHLEVAPTVAWAITQVGAPDVAALFGPAALAPNDIGEHGLTAYLRSSAHWTERGRRQVRLTENWVLWQAGRARRLVTGQSALYERRRQRAHLRRGG